MNMTKPPCKTPDGIDCPRRYIGCRAECEAYHEWLAKHEAEKERAQKNKHNEADDFLIGQQERVKRARHRDYMRGYNRK